MGTGVAVTKTSRLVVGLVVLTVLSGCGNDNVDVDGPPLVATAGKMVMSAVAERRAQRSGAGAKADKGPSRAELEKAGAPVLRAKIPARQNDAFLTILESRDDVVVWTTSGGITFALRNGVVIQTRGLGPDLMSSTVPSVGQLLQDGGTHQRQYFFLGPNDQPTRRTYDCTVASLGADDIEIMGRAHRVVRTTEECTRPQSGKITNEYWIEGRTIRKSKQWISALVGTVQFDRIID
jgi:hypothetical protein